MKSKLFFFTLLFCSVTFAHAKLNYTPAHYSTQDSIQPNRGQFIDAELIVSLSPAKLSPMIK